MDVWFLNQLPIRITRVALHPPAPAPRPRPAQHRKLWAGSGSLRWLTLPGASDGHWTKTLEALPALEDNDVMTCAHISKRIFPVFFLERLHAFLSSET